MAAEPLDIARLRRETPACLERIHLNNAGASLMPTRVLFTVQDHLVLESRIGGYEAAAERADAIEAAYHSIGNLVGAGPENIAFTENATAAYVQALSAIVFQPGDVILTTRNDYASNQIQFLSLQSRMGVQVIRAPDVPGRGVDVSAMAELVRRHRPKIVCVTHVPTSSGLEQDVVAIGAICAAAETWYLVDACQSVGQIPLDVNRIRCDFLTASARKFLRGPRGIGFLFVSDRALQAGLEPLFPDMRGADWTAENAYTPRSDAKRFENWEFPWALVLGMAEAARYAGEIGVARIETRIESLMRHLHTRLSGIDGVTALDARTNRRGIFTVSVAGQDPAEIVTALRNRGINTSHQVREFALLNYADKGVPGAVRISPHCFNTDEEIDAAIDALGELAPGSTTR